MAKAAAKGKSGKKKFKSRAKKSVSVGIVHVQATFNNTIVTITDQEGNVMSWSSSGSLGFRGSQKGTPFAAQQASLTAANAAKDHGLRQVSVRVKGPAADASRRSGRCRLPAFTSRTSATSRRFRTTGAGRPRSGAFDATTRPAHRVAAGRAIG